MKNKYLPSILTALLLILFWELYSGATHASSLFFPAPSQIFNSFARNRDVIAIHLLQTCLETVLGFFISIVIGTVTAFLFTLYPVVRKTFYPFIVISQTIPLIALAPLLMIWFGFGLTPKIIMVILYCFFPITVALTDALNNIDRDLVNLLVSMNADKFRILKLARLPASLPAFFSGTKIAAAYSVSGAIAGEFVGAYQGLGVYMKMAANSHAFPLVYASILMVCLVSLLLFLLVRTIEKSVIKWQS